MNKPTVTSSSNNTHISTTRDIMLDVIIALLPAAVFGCILFGLRAVLILVTCIASAVLSEYVWCKILHKENSIKDLSAVVTGLLLGMTLSPMMPFWMAATGSVVAVIVIKQMFGGIGHNFVNPAAAARVVLLVSFPTHMTQFARVLHGYMLNLEIGISPLADGAAQLTPQELFLGFHPGSIGETSAFLLLIGGVYLVLRRIINPIIPLCFIGTVGVMSLIFGDSITLNLFGGGLMLGAIFMATDTVTTPATRVGKLIFGVGCGIITFALGKWWNLPEGVAFAILLMNILTPHIDTLTALKPFGVKEAKQNG